MLAERYGIMDVWLAAALVSGIRKWRLTQLSQASQCPQHVLAVSGAVALAESEG